MRWAKRRKSGFLSLFILLLARSCAACRRVFRSREGIFPHILRDEGLAVIAADGAAQELRIAKDYAEELKAVGVKNMAHEKASKIRADLRMTLCHGVRFMHVRYLQEDPTELLTTRHKDQALKDQIIELGYVVKSSHSVLSMKVRRDENVEDRERRNAYCALRALEITPKRALGRIFKAYYEKLLGEVKKILPGSLLTKGKLNLTPSMV